MLSTLLTSGFEDVGNLLVVFLGQRNGLLPSLSLFSLNFSLVLQALRGNETLNLGGFASGLLSVTDNLATNDELANVVLLGEVEELADASCALRTEAAGLVGISQAWNLSLALLDNNQVDDGQVATDDAPTDRLAFTLTATANSVARVACRSRQQECQTYAVNSTVYTARINS